MNRPLYHDNKQVMYLDCLAADVLEAVTTGDPEDVAAAGLMLAGHVKRLVDQGVLPSGEQNLG